MLWPRIRMRSCTWIRRIWPIRSTHRPPRRWRSSSAPCCRCWPSCCRPTGGGYQSRSSWSWWRWRSPAGSAPASAAAIRAARWSGWPLGAPPDWGSPSGSVTFLGRLSGDRHPLTVAGTAGCGRNGRLTFLRPRTIWVSSRSCSTGLHESRPQHQLYLPNRCDNQRPTWWEPPVTPSTQRLVRSGRPGHQGTRAACLSDLREVQVSSRWPLRRICDLTGLDYVLDALLRAPEIRAGHRPPLSRRGDPVLDDLGNAAHRGGARPGSAVLPVGGALVGTTLLLGSMTVAGT